MFCTPAETVKARKAHKCTYCGEWIKPGELYDTWKSVDDSWFTNKMHPECNEEVSEDGYFEYTPFCNERPDKGETA